MTRKTRIITICLAVAISATGLIALAGDLNPPVGPVAPTQRTPVNANMTPGDADSLFKITQPGSYYLTGNVSGVVAKHGIEIAASGVTLDLNGFDLLGVAGSLDGVSVTLGALSNIAVVNGSVRNWGDEGVDIGTNGALNCRVEGVLASGNVGIGINVGLGCTVTNCSAFDNTANGIFAGGGCTVSHCSVYLNTGNGISTGSGNTVSHCSVYLNTGNGISTSVANTVSNCTAYQNTGNGIITASSCTVADCTVRSNTLDGILCTSSCLIRGNNCAFSGSGAGDGAGIHATGSDNRIEGNNSIVADRGIDVDSSGNFITRNMCSGNTVNWDIAANNKCLVILGVNAAAINGDSGGTAPGSTDPNANFTY